MIEAAYPALELKGHRMDFSKLSLGSKLILGAGLLLLIDSFLHWQSVSIFSANMWHGWGVVAGLTLLVILAWEGARQADIKIALGPLSPSMLAIVLSALLLLFTFIKAVGDSYGTVWAWIGFVLSAGVAAGAWLNMQAAGESLSDLKATVASAAGSSSAPAAPAEPETHDAGSGPADTAT